MRQLTAKGPTAPGQAPARESPGPSSPSGRHEVVGGERIKSLYGSRDLFQLLGGGRAVVAFRAWLIREEKAGRFPRRLHLSQRVIAWDVTEVDAWLAERRGERNATATASPSA